MIDFRQNHYELFGLQPRFKLDLSELEQAYRSLQSRVHPDKFVHAGDAERRVSMQSATQVNEAYRTLKSPLARARYLLALQQVDVHSESNTAMPPEFLLRQMEWREAIGEAKDEHDVDALEKLARELQRDAAALQQHLGVALDDAGDLDGAAVLVRKLRFLEKLEQEIGDAIESLLF